MQRDSLILAEARQIASGKIESGFNPESNALAPLFQQAEGYYAGIGGGIALLVASPARRWSSAACRSTSGREPGSSDG